MQRGMASMVRSRTTASSFMTALKACAEKKDLYQLSKIHADIYNSGLLQRDPYLGSALVSMYAKCGALTKARKVVGEIAVRDVVILNALIAGYAQHGCGKEALACFQQMRSEGLSPNAVTYVSTLKACAITQNVDVGERIHDEIASQGLLEKHVVLGGALVDMYAKCGFLRKAQKVLDELPVRNVVSWSALIAGYAQHGCGKEALDCFQRMRSEGISPNAITYGCTLKACGIMQDVDMGDKIHDEIANLGLLEKHVVLGGALVDMYTKCGSLMKAQKVLDKLPVRNVVSWCTLVSGYAQHGCGKEALACFQRMRSEGLSPDVITYACILKACAITQDIDMGKRIHDEIARQGLLEKHVMLGGALIDMYAKCGVLVKAHKVLVELPVRDVVSWSALIAGYAQHDFGSEALACFHEMQSDGLSPNAVTYACALKACSITREVAMGDKIHYEIARQGLLEKHVVLHGALVDMYAKCGFLKKAQKVLNELPVRDAVSWNALIGGYAQHGCGKEALACFQWMQQEGTSPTAITFVCVLSSCSHSGLVDEGQTLFDIMTERYGILPEEESYTCMVDLFGRARHFDKAMRVIKMMPASIWPSVLSALLGACREWGNVELGRLAYERVIEGNDLC
ncbi:hypothetical protein GOP47_0026038 [Adiantum capillus-veneris]|uniref:Pentatricopeptide repeat-containing protein n=1 Tax=Adiantum capillus-veneris TaxID=13818 RepID=A0A9D4U1D1_ADICA|nr:hypothetical protein GOP47_0026038 [Adiantum capillus-veneris]